MAIARSARPDRYRRHRRRLFEIASRRLWWLSDQHTHGRGHVDTAANERSIHPDPNPPGHQRADEYALTDEHAVSHQHAVPNLHGHADTDRYPLKRGAPKWRMTDPSGRNAVRRW